MHPLAAAAHLAGPRPPRARWRRCPDAADVDERVRGPQVDGQIAREEGVQPVEHRGWSSFPGKVQATESAARARESKSPSPRQTVARHGPFPEWGRNAACLVAAPLFRGSRPRARAAPPCASRAATTWLLVLTSAPGRPRGRALHPLRVCTAAQRAQGHPQRGPPGPQVAVNVWFHVGAASQRPGKSGFAHLFEHMMFSAGEHIPSPTRCWPPSAAQANGSTNFDRTNYLRDGAGHPAPHGPLAGERPDGVPPAHPRPEEAGDPAGRSEQRAAASASRTSPTAAPSSPCATRSTPSRIPTFTASSGPSRRSRPRAWRMCGGFFREYYRPSNATLALVGDFRPQRSPGSW